MNILDNGEVTASDDHNDIYGKIKDAIDAGYQTITLYGAAKEEREGQEPVYSGWLVSIQQDGQ